jgi:hypothetical protein
LLLSWSTNLGFLTEGKSAAIFITPSSWGSQRAGYLLAITSPSSNAKPTHNTTKNFAPNLRWGCQSHRFAANKGLSVSSGKRIIVCKKVNSASKSKTV